ncbi:MAG: hypothetical protein M1834_005468 [Cirrosporium novae-zelandiae]|nr:MAG: hypothetical protein M1834_005468 [Cirrosporium novae-zelandiae]
MADEDPSPQLSIRDRIATLNLGQVGRTQGNSSPSNVSSSHLPPVPPTKRPTVDIRRKSATNPINGAASGKSVGNEPIGKNNNSILPPPTITRTGQTITTKAKPAPPPLPARRPSTQPPALPPRRPSEQLRRKISLESASSAISTVSSRSTGTTISKSRSPSRDPSHRIRAPVYDPSALPPLPPKRTTETKAPQNGYRKLVKSASTIGIKQVSEPPKQIKPPVPSFQNEPLTPRKLPPPASHARPSALSFGLNKESETTLPVPQNRPISSSSTEQGNAPPPIPLATRPDLSKIQATKPKVSPSSSQAGCMKCRDFSGPDNHAKQFPRQSLPSNNLDWLANQLTAPFYSHTDKARAIFTWLHYNVRYDVDAFFNNRVKPSTPASTLASGLAVCEGFAGLFTALASRAGLESFVVGGHGKGFGYLQLAPGSRVPPFASNHAWNVVKIDNGEWKLIDACWGAGNVGGKGQPYNQVFSPVHFTMDNNEFGLRHFPTNRDHFFRIDGRPSISWEEYMLGDPSKPEGRETPQIFNMVGQEGFHELKFLPAAKTINIHQHPEPMMRFQFEKICEHWDPVRNGRGPHYQYILAIHGQDGRKDDFVPFESNGMYWWCDVAPYMLGAPGQTVTAFAVTTVQGQDGRGLSIDEYRNAKGRKGMGFGGLVAWQLV